jgi:ornithine cyclodeaminase/alanine dehydrogenase-like protein (mu-crystallin family)
MRFFNRETIDRIPYDIIQKAVKQAYLLQLTQKFHMPDRIHVSQKENTLLLMPCFGDAYMATKLVTVFPKASETGFPVVNGMVILADNHTGQPLAILDGAALTSRRTGAVGGLATACLSPESVRTAGVIGAGVQGRSQAAFLLFNRQIDTLWVSDVNRAAAENMVTEIHMTWPGISCRVAKSPRDLVNRSQVVIAATTSTQPVFEADPSDIQGKTFISIGSFTPQMKEFPDAVIKEADAVYVDTLFATEESGDLCQPLENKVVSREKILAFASVVQQPVDLSGATVFFKSVGMALFDLTVAAAVLEWGNQENQGQTLSM